MASDLERFRDHCRKMADSTPATRIKAAWTGPRWQEQVMPVGEIPDHERDLWRRLADEIDGYLTGVETEPLFTH